MRNGQFDQSPVRSLVLLVIRVVLSVTGLPLHEVHRPAVGRVVRSGVVGRGAAVLGRRRRRVGALGEDVVLAAAAVGGRAVLGVAGLVVLIVQVVPLVLRVRLRVLVRVDQVAGRPDRLVGRLGAVQVRFAYFVT